MVRPREWWSAQALAPSGRVWVDFPEIELFGWATVERVTAAPQEIAGRGCLVLMTVSHVGSEILKLAFAETDETVELTPVHRLFSEERGWVQARLLTVGERLRSGSGGVTVASIADAIPNRRVYNLEVGREHSFRVLRSQIWAHNTDYGNGAPGGAKGRGTPNELPALDSTGKVHGNLPKPKDLGRYSPDELQQLTGELEQSVQERIRKTVELGPHKPHGERQAAEQQLIQDIVKNLEDR